MSGIRERVLLDGGWRDTAHQPLEVSRVFRTEAGAEAVLDLIWHKDRLIWGSRILKEFDASGKETLRTTSMYDGAGWRAEAPVFFAYDAAGNLLGEAADGRYRYDHAYDAGGNRVSSRWSSWESGAWEAHILETREYDAAGRIASSVVHRRVTGGSNALVPSERTLHAYPGQGRHESSEWGWDGVQWIQYSLERERFDTGGTLIERIGCTLSGDVWVEYGKTAFAYDARGNLLERTLRILSPTGEMLGGKKEVYSYAAAVSLSPRERAVRDRSRPLAGRRGSFFLFLEGSKVLDLRGRTLPAP